MQRVNPSSSSPNHHHLDPSLLPSPHRASQIPATLQPRSSLFNPLPPSPFTSDHLPPRKSHRRSNSDIISGPPERSEPDGFFKPRKSEMDDVFTAYMNLDNIDVLNSFGNANGEEIESSGTKKTTNGSDSEGDSTASLKSSSSGVKRRGGALDIAPATRHYRSVSMDSCFLVKLNFDDEPSPRPPPTEGNSSVDFGNSEFTPAEMSKIAADDKLAEILVTDPKRVKRILANRVSAARSKERKTQYTAELEHKVQTLQTQATSLSAQLTHLQRDSMGLTNQNSELKFRLHAMEQQAQLRDALSEKLTAEVQRLKMVIGETSYKQGGSSSEFDKPKTSLNPEMFQQLSISQLKHSSQNSSMKPGHASNE